MKIYVKASDTKRPIRLVFPLALIKTKFIYRQIAKHQKNTFDHNLAHSVSKKAYKELRKYIKKYGHFNLIEVKEKNGDTVIIRL